MEWHNLHLNVQNIEAETENGLLIVIPKRVCEKLGLMEETKFWHPRKLVRNNGGKGWHKSLGIRGDFVVKAFRNGKGKYNKFEKIEEIEIDGADLIDAWEGEK